MATLMNASSTLALQVLGVVTLRPAAYGLYSLPYLVGAFGTLIMLATVADVSARRSIDDVGEWAPYSSVAALVASTGGLLAFVAAAAALHLSAASAAAFIAVTAQTYRVAERFHEVRARHLRRVLLADGAGLVAVPFAWLCLGFADTDSLDRVMWVWAVSSAAQLVFARRPAQFHWVYVRQWIATNRHDIRTLLGDTAITSAGTFGTPVVLASLLGLATLGIYRSMNNLTSSITLLMGPIRPQMARYKPDGWYRRRFVFRLGCAAVIVGLIVAGGLFVVTHLLVSKASTLASLRPYAGQAGVSVAATLVATVYGMAARFFATRKDLLVARSFQALTALAFPLIGSLISFDAVINGFAAAAVASCVSWVVVGRRRVRNAVPETELIRSEARGALVDEL